MLKEEPTRRGFEEMARSLHASYLSRWNRHDPAGLERASKQEAERRKLEGAAQGKSSAA